VSGERKLVEAREAEGEEAERLWQAFVNRLPAIADSRALARRNVPMMVLAPVHPAHHEAGKQEDNDHADQGADDAAQVERVVISDPEAGREDGPAEGRADEAEHDRDQPRARPVHSLEHVVGDKHPSDRARHQSK
jgi:hypothetical protein